MQVYVQNRDGQPLMPTRRLGKVRRLLKENRATVVRSCPFTIRLKQETTAFVQPVSLGIDAGSMVVGASATTAGRVLYESETELRTDVKKLIAQRKQLRRGRRYRKTRYRMPRFSNRANAREKGRLAPSVQQKIVTHLRVIRDICRILPVSSITIETASFDIQKIKALLEEKAVPEGTDYQQVNSWDSGT